MKRALLIVDVQNDFTEGGALGVEGGSAVASGIADLLAETRSTYDLVIASRDWHDAEGGNGGHFAPEGEAPDFVNTWPVHCVAGTEGAAYHPSLDISAIDVHLRKGMGVPDYSAFQGQSIKGQLLGEILHENSITHLDVVGIATDYCVRASTLDALGEGLQVRVLSDLVASVAPETGVAAVKEMASAGATIQ